MEGAIEKLRKYYYVPKKEKDTNLVNKVADSIMNMSLLDIKDCDFRNSTSGFGKREMDALNISIEEVYDIEVFFGLTRLSFYFANSFTLSNYAQNAGEYECRRLDLELKRVKENNKVSFTKNGCSIKLNVNEQYVNSLVDTLFRFSCLYDAKHFELLVPRHELDICGKKCGSNVDREMRVIKTGMIFLVEESKHITTSSYLKGDLQLACNLIVAYQENLKIANKENMKVLETIFGIKIIGTEAFVYFMNYDRKYLEYLRNGKNRTEIKIYKLLVEKNPINIAYNSDLILFINILYSIGNSVFKSLRNTLYSEQHSINKNKNTEKETKNNTKNAIVNNFRNYYHTNY